MLHLLLSACGIAIFAAVLIQNNVPIAFTALGIGFAFIAAIIYNLLTDA